MATTTKTKSASPRRSVALTKGDWLDVMDQDGVWNVARVLSVPSSEEVEVMYDGWPEEYDEVVRVDSDRVAPYHTFTWAVKCWVKYLNWPLWPSVITIRTPGTLDGIKNLSMENRLYVDFLEDLTFANRDRCWQKKRQVKLFASNFDKNRKQTNGAQFEVAFGCVLQSDATTKLPTFARGTLPLQYENSTTESVERMRKNMGSKLWYRNFANNKERHMKTHKYETIGDEDKESSSDKAVPVPKLKVRRPKTSLEPEDQDTIPSKKKKRPFPAKQPPVVVKIEQEPLATVGLGDIDSSDNQESEGERNAALTKKRRLRSKGPSAVSPVARKEMPPKKAKCPSSPQESNAPIGMLRHVTVLMDEIIVDDDADTGDEVDQTKVARRTRRSPRQSLADNSSTHATDTLVMEATDTTESSGKLRPKAKTSSPVGQRSRQGEANGSAIHRKTRNVISREPAEPVAERSNRRGSFLSLSGEDSDEDMYSDSFDPGTTSEAASPCDAKSNSPDSVMTALLSAKSKSAERPKVRSDDRAVSTDAVVTPRSTKRKGKGKAKMAARRSVLPLQGDLNLTASSKSRTSRPSRSLSDDDDWENEEKGVVRDAAKEVERHDKVPIKAVRMDPSKQPRDSKQDAESGVVAAAPKSSKDKPPKRPKTPLPLIEQRIAFAQEALRDLNEEKMEALKATAKEQQKRSSSSSSSRSRNGSQERAKQLLSRQPKHLNFSFLRVDDMDDVSPGVSGGTSDREGRLPDLKFSSNELGHSFLSVDSSDSPDSKSVSTLFDEDMALDFQSEPKETTASRKPEAKLVPETEIVASADEKKKSEDGDDDGDEKAQQKSQRFCMMHAGLEGPLDGDEEENKQPRNTKKTVISMLRKFDGAANGATVSVPTPSSVVFSSSKGFSMEKWFKRSFTVGGPSSKTWP